MTYGVALKPENISDAMKKLTVREIKLGKVF